jgi:hypothetical protein
VARVIIRAAGCLFLLVLAGLAAMLARNYARTHPQDVPWTRLELDDPIGRFTHRKLVALHGNLAECKSLLAAAGAPASSVPDRSDGERCGYDDGMRLHSSKLRFQPEGPVTSCPVAAALYIFDQQVLRPAATKHFRKPVVAIIHVGSYSCRRLYNRADGAFSEHATANAFDITGFVLKDGERVSVLKDWNSTGPKAAFLREVRTGACGLFATVLSPDYNQAHADHLHLDQADRGSSGWTMCR